jgi:hypothetical protein
MYIIYWETTSPADFPDESVISNAQATSIIYRLGMTLLSLIVQQGWWDPILVKINTI